MSRSEAAYSRRPLYTPIVLERATEATLLSVGDHVASLSDAMEAFARASRTSATLHDATAQWVGRLMGDACVVLTRARPTDALTVRSVWTRDPRHNARIQVLGQRIETDAYPIPQRVMATGEPVSLQSLADGLGTIAMTDLGMRSTLLLPLRIGDGVAGMIAVFRASSSIESFDLQRAVDLVHHASLAITNVHLREIAEAEIDRSARANDDLQHVRSRLRQALKMDALGRLAGGIAHDFNNLLSIVLSHTTLLLWQLDEDSPLRQELESVKYASECAAELTHQLLAFSGKQLLHPQSVQLDVLVREAERLAAGTLGSGVSLRVRQGCGGARTKVDPNQLQQVLLNLLVNARDAMPQGGEIAIETRATEVDGGPRLEHLGLIPGAYLVVSVSDTGTGIDAATRESIFEPFFTTKPPGHGTGLGLATALGIVRQSGGCIDVVSTPGRGSTFSVYLPRTMAATAELPRVDSPGLLGGDETILLVEDEPALRDVVRTILEASGYLVLEAEDCEHALRIATETKQQIHLLVTDLIMPRVGGRVLAASVQKLRPDIGCLYISGYAEDVIRARGLGDGGVDFLRKPITPDALQRGVREALDRAAANRRSRIAG